MKKHQLVLYLICGLTVAISLSVSIVLITETVEVAYGKFVASIVFSLLILAWFGFIKYNKMD